MTGQIDAFLSEWTMAEQAGDTTILDQQLTADFYGVGPLGFILPRAAWLARHGQGDLAYAAFSLEEQQSRVLGPVAVVTARNNTRGTYRGRPIPEAARATLVLTRDTGGWKLAVIHMSFIAGTQGAPPLPGPASQAGQGAPR
jgi:ketosteroid isomerase-like protein